MAETIAREAWILSRVRDGRPEHLGIFRSKEVAEENVEEQTRDMISTMKA